jgi:hypothetical protein
LQEKYFYDETIAILRKREIFIDQVWVQSLRHQDSQAICEYISSPNCSYRLNLIGYMRSKLFDKCPTLKKDVRFFEYNPMINSRAHKVGLDSEKNRILNKTFRETYDKFLQMMAFKPVLTQEEKMVYIYYLQL